MAATAPRRLLPVLFAATVLSVMTSCAPNVAPIASPSMTASGMATAPSSSSPGTPTPSASGSAVIIPVGVSCAQLVPPNAIYAFNPNFSAVHWTPAAGSLEATAVALGGVACRWINETSGETIDLGAAKLDPGNLKKVKTDAASAGNVVPTYGDEAYFSTANGVGTANVFSRSSWVVTSSTYFTAAGEASPIVDPALSALN